MTPVAGKRVLVTGGTGSLGKLLVHRLLSGEFGTPESVTVLSRDEAKQHQMRLDYLHAERATDDAIFSAYRERLRFHIGDVRDFDAMATAMRSADIVVNAAALKQVPTAEYHPAEAVRTNVEGAENIVRVIEQLALDVEAVVGVSTDKAAKPVNVMGMTKALQERIFIQANLRVPATRFVGVRYGNVLASRGSVIPLFHQQIRAGGPVTITAPEMTRFLLSLNDAVDTVMAALELGRPGELFVPTAPAARITDVATALIGDRAVETVVIGVRPGEKLHEVLVTEEEAPRTRRVDGWLAIGPMLPDLVDELERGAMSGDYSSADHVISPDEVQRLLADKDLLDPEVATGELLR